MAPSVSNLPSEVRDALVSRLEAAPVRLAVLFGSYATGQATKGSDIDLAVAYDPRATDVTDVHLSLVADLTRILGRDDIDVIRLTSADPRIAVEALDHGHILVGTADDVQQLRDKLEPARQERAERMEARIDAAERAIERRMQRREHGG